MSFDFCPNCAIDGKVSELEYLQQEDCALAMCPDVDCGYNYEGHCIRRTYGSAPLPEWVLEKMGLPQTLAIEPRMKHRHTDTILWLNSIRQAAYLWLSEEVLSMSYADRPRLSPRGYNFTLSPSIKRLMMLTAEEIHLGKQIIPDLVRIVLTLNYYYKAFGFPPLTS